MSSKTNTSKYNRNNLVEARTKFESRFLLLPLILIVTILPTIVKMYQYHTGLSIFNWYAPTDEAIDFFLFYKQWFFVSISGIMLLILCFRALVNKKNLKFAPIFIPLGIYAILALLSTIFSEYTSFGITGIYDQFENIFALLGYALVVYYAFLVIRSEQEITLMIDSLAVGALILGLLGSFQAFGLDFLNSYEGKSLIADAFTAPEEIGLVFEKGRTYATLYNPNYVGVYTSFIIPMFSVILIHAKKVYQYVLYGLVIITSIISLFGSQSKAGFVSILFAAIFIAILLRKSLLKKWIIIVPIVLIMIGSFFFINKINDNAYLNAIQNAFKINKTPKPDLSKIETKEDGVFVTYKKHTFQLLLNTVDNAISIVAIDSSNTPIEFIMEEDGFTYTFTDERFHGIQMFPALYGEIPSIGLRINGVDWYFSNMTGSGTYEYFHRYGKTISIGSPETAVFDGYENFATNRGYIWSRTIPLLKDYLFLGSGADTFIIAFPQDDYVGFYNYGYMSQILSKPHSLYLQIAVQTGVLSLIAFLAFYLMYFISCIKIYIKGKFSSSTAYIGIGIFVGTISYMVSAITNDSSITVAPVFWVMSGVGIVTNQIVKYSDIESKTSIERE